MWATFLAYRDFAYPDGPLGQFRPRVVARIAAELGLTDTTLRAYMTRGQFVTRASAWDVEIETAKRDRTLSSIQKMRIRNERALSELHEVLSLERAKLLDRALDPEKPALTPRELTSLQDLVLRHEQILVGITDSEDQKTKDEGLDISNWDTATLESMRAQAEKSGQTKN